MNEFPTAAPEESTRPSPEIGTAQAAIDDNRYLEFQVAQAAEFGLPVLEAAAHCLMKSNERRT